MTEIGSLIKRHRIMLALTQRELGEFLDVGSQYISNIERGKSLPPKRKFTKLISKLKIDKNTAISTFNSDYSKRLK